MAPVAPIDSTSRPGTPAPPLARDEASVLRAIERHAEYLRTAGHSPSQLFAWTSVLVSAGLWIVVPQAFAGIYASHARSDAGYPWLYLVAIASSAFGVWRVWRHAKAPVVREPALVADAIETPRRGRGRMPGGRGKRGSFEVVIATSTGTRRLDTDPIVFLKVHLGARGIAWRRGRYLLDWLPVDA